MRPIRLKAESKYLQSQKMGRIQAELEALLDAAVRVTYDSLSQAQLSREAFLFVAPNLVRFHQAAKQQA